MTKTKQQIRDEEARKYNATEFGSKIDFKAGWDSRDRLDNEALKIALSALEKIGHDVTINCQADDAENECFDVAQVALAEIKKIVGEG